MDISFDLQSVSSNLIHLAIAFLVALPIGWERERATRRLGLRTFPLVAVATCAYILVGESFVEASPDARARLMQGLMSGLGFIGGGAILKNKNRVKGTATAASVWTTGAAGAAVGFQRYEIAIAIVLINFVILRWLHPLSDKLDSEKVSSEKKDDQENN